MEGQPRPLSDRLSLITRYLFLTPRRFFNLDFDLLCNNHPVATPQHAPFAQGGAVFDQPDIPCTYIRASHYLIV
jgi:hypothetical protein